MRSSTSTASSSRSTAPASTPCTGKRAGRRCPSISARSARGCSSWPARSLTACTSTSCSRLPTCGRAGGDRQGRAAADRGGPATDISQIVSCSVDDDDPQTAIDAWKSFLTLYLAQQPHIAEHCGAEPDSSTASRRWPAGPPPPTPSSGPCSWSPTAGPERHRVRQHRRGPSPPSPPTTRPACAARSSRRSGDKERTLRPSSPRRPSDPLGRRRPARRHGRSRAEPRPRLRRWFARRQSEGV